MPDRVFCDQRDPKHCAKWVNKSRPLFDDICPYCEIERLKGELEEAVSSCRLWQIELELEQSSCSIRLDRIIDLERQLDASQSLLAEAEYQIEKQSIETRAATQLACDYIKQLAEAKEREDVDSMRIHLLDEEVQCLRKYLASARAELENTRLGTRLVADEIIAEARREGWEQCQREARGKLSARYERYLNSETIYILNEIECCERAIAAMEYKEKVND